MRPVDRLYLSSSVYRSSTRGAVACAGPAASPWPGVWVDAIGFMEARQWARSPHEAIGKAVCGSQMVQGRPRAPVFRPCGRALGGQAAVARAAYNGAFVNSVQVGSR